MKFGQLIEYNMRNNFLEKSYTKCEGETNSRPFSKTQDSAISGSLVWSFKRFFYCLPSWGSSKDTETKMQTTCFYLI